MKRGEKGGGMMFLTNSSRKRKGAGRFWLFALLPWADGTRKKRMAYLPAQKDTREKKKKKGKGGHGRGRVVFS